MMDLHFVSAEESDIPVIFAQTKNLIDTYEIHNIYLPV